jgi:hypothetical protein
MKIENLLHVIRAISGVTDYDKFLIVGSQAVLGHHYNMGLDYFFDYSTEVDIAPIPDNEMMSLLIDGSLGENSMFHITHGYYAHGVDQNICIFPKDWKQRLLKIDFFDKVPVVLYFASIEDVFISKIAAYRDKDVFFVRKILEENMIDRNLLVSLLDKLPDDLSYDQKLLIKERVNLHLQGNSVNLKPGGES